MPFSIAALIVLILIWMVFVGLGIASISNAYDIVDAVNSELPENERFDWLIWYPEKHERLRREYRRLFPAGKLLRRQRILGICMLGFGLAAASILLSHFQFTP